MFGHIRGQLASLGTALVLLCGSSALAGVYRTIAVDGQFDDWNGVPAAYTDAVNHGTTIDVASVQIANDEDYLYLRINYRNEVNPNANSITLAFDTDNNASTGFNIYGSGVVGSEFGYQNDYGFDQRTGFNVGGLSDGAAISPYFTNTTSQEYRIPRALTYSNDNALAFDHDSFTMMIWADGSPSYASGAIAYSFAAIPEPASLSALALGTLTLLRRRRS